MKILKLLFLLSFFLGLTAGGFADTTKPAKGGFFKWKHGSVNTARTGSTPAVKSAGTQRPKGLSWFKKGNFKAGSAGKTAARSNVNSKPAQGKGFSGFKFKKPTK